jgi:hypothetical protein
VPELSLVHPPPQLKAHLEADGLFFGRPQTSQIGPSRRRKTSSIWVRQYDLVSCLVRTTTCSPNQINNRFTILFVKWRQRIVSLASHTKRLPPRHVGWYDVPTPVPRSLRFGVELGQSEKWKKPSSPLGFRRFAHGSRAPTVSTIRFFGVVRQTPWARMVLERSEAPCKPRRLRLWRWI